MFIGFAELLSEGAHLHLLVYVDLLQNLDFLGISGDSFSDFFDSQLERSPIISRFCLGIVVMKRKSIVYFLDFGLTDGHAIFGDFS